MKKIFLLALLGICLTLTGCIQNTSNENPNLNQPIIDKNQSLNSNQPRANNCAVIGEKPTNFDMTTGQLVSEGKPCCNGLTAIGPKTSDAVLAQGICNMIDGVRGICSPCGDEICNQDYEDKCNCPKDCQ